MALKKYKTKKGMRFGYEIQIQEQRYSKSGFKTKRKAQLAEIEEEKRLSESGNNLDFRLLIVERLKFLKEFCTENYYKENYRTYSKLAVHFKHVVFVEEFTRDDIQEYLEANHKKVHGYNYALKRLKSLFQFGIEKEWTVYDPCKGLKRKPFDRTVKYIPSQEDIYAVINSAEKLEDRLFLIVLKNTLARVSEIYNLQWEDVNIDNRRLTLWTRKKLGGVRTPRHLTINNTLYDALSQIKKEHKHVFWCKRSGMQYMDRKKLLIRLCKKAKVKRFTFHSFRHFGASQLAMKNVSLPEIQMILGHDNVITTSKYIQSLGINKTEAINLLD